MTSAVGALPSQVLRGLDTWDARRGSEIGWVSFKVSKKRFPAIVFMFLSGILKPLRASLLKTIVKRSLESPL